MLATRIIPTVLCRGRTLVKGTQFNSWRSVGHAAQACRVHAARGCDELILLDIGATPEGRGPDLSLIKELADVFFVPVTVGGGVKSVDDVTQLLRHGADKVAIGSAIFKTGLLDDISHRFGNQVIVASIDYKDNGYVWIECGKTVTHWNPVQAARRCEQHGAGEILLTSIDREGMMEGYDLDLIHAVSSAVNIPVIAHGGCGTPEHMLEAIQAGAHAVAAGAMFTFTDVTPASAAKYLREHGITTRIPNEVAA